MPKVTEETISILENLIHDIRMGKYTPVASFHSVSDATSLVPREHLTVSVTCTFNQTVEDIIE